MLYGADGYPVNTFRWLKHWMVVRGKLLYLWQQLFYKIIGYQDYLLVPQ